LEDDVLNLDMDTLSVNCIVMCKGEKIL